MDRMDAVWLFLKDYQTYIPGVEGAEGMNTPQWLPDMPEARDRRWYDRFTDPGTKARMRAYKLQQGRFVQQMRDWARDDSRAVAGGATRPREPLFEAGPHWGYVRDSLYQPGDKPRLRSADVDIEHPEHNPPDTIMVKPHATGEILPRNILGEGGYLQALGNWLQGNQDTGKFGRKRAMEELGTRPREFPVEPKDELEPPGKDEFAIDDDIDEGVTGLTTEQREAEGLRTRRNPNTLAGATSPLADDWHKGFNKKGKYGGTGEHHPEGQTWAKYGEHLGDVHKKNFTVDPPESDRDSLHNFVTKKLLGNDTKRTNYYNYQMKDQLEKLFKENPEAGIKWLRAHPGWEEAIPDKFKWRPTGTAAEENTWKFKGKSKKKPKKKDMEPVPPPVKGATLGDVDDEVGTSFDQMDPMDTAWAVLKLG